MRDFLGSTLPEASKQKSARSQIAWKGLKLRSREAGYITDGQNFIITPEGHLRAADKPEQTDFELDNPIGLYGIDDQLFAVYTFGNTTYLKRLSDDVAVSIGSGDAKRSIVKYNVWTGKSDIVNGTYEPKLLVYPDKKEISFVVEDNTPTLMAADIQQTAYTKRIDKTTTTTTTIYDNSAFGVVHHKTILRKTTKTEKFGFLDFGFSITESVVDYTITGSAFDTKTEKEDGTGTQESETVAFKVYDGNGVEVPADAIVDYLQNQGTTYMGTTYVWTPVLYRITVSTKLVNVKGNAPGEEDTYDIFGSPAVSRSTSSEEKGATGSSTEREYEEDDHRGDGTTPVGTPVYTYDDSTGVPTLTVTTVTETTKTVYSKLTYDTPQATGIAVYNTRVFGVNGSKIFASGTNSYTDYDLDTATDIDENNAWYSASAEGGDFTAIVTYGGRVTAFKKNLLVELYNTKNPFRIKEISKTGTFSASSVAETASTLFFASNDGIYAYTGAYPRNISKEAIPLEILTGNAFEKGIAGAFDGKYILRENYAYNDLGYLTSNKPCFVYDAYTGAWSVSNFFSSEIVSFANGNGHQYALLSDGSIYQMDTHGKEGTKWYVETPIEYDGTASPKVLEKLQALLRFHTSGTITFKIKYDNGAYEEVGTLSKESGVHPLYMKVRKGDHVARFIRIEAEGDVEVVTLEQILSAGGEQF